MDSHSPGCVRLAGVDEAGRGPLAGPVVAAAVILGAGHGIIGLADSKVLSRKKREALAAVIEANALCWATARASVEEIECINILQASLLAMRRAVGALTLSPDLVLVDGNQVPQLEYEVRAIVKGDSKVAEISAASILAKVVRDDEMRKLDRQYPGYGFAQHKGYPTKVHLQALETLGVSPVHRRTFAPVRRVIASRESRAPNSGR